MLQFISAIVRALHEEGDMSLIKNRLLRSRYFLFYFLARYEYRQPLIAPFLFSACIRLYSVILETFGFVCFLFFVVSDYLRLRCYKNDCPNLIKYAFRVDRRQYALEFFGRTLFFAG